MGCLLSTAVESILLPKPYSPAARHVSATTSLAPLIRKPRLTIHREWTPEGADRHPRTFTPSAIGMDMGCLLTPALEAMLWPVPCS